MHKFMRPVAVVAAGAVIATSFAAPSQAAPEDRGVDWLQQQLTDGIVHNDQFDFDDYGLTIDVGLAMVGEDDATLVTIREALSEHVDSYTTGADFGAPDDVYAGALAKLAAFVHQAGGSPRNYGGANLIQRLNQRISDQAPNAGRLQDKAEDDFANTIGQVFAFLALSNEGSGKAGDAMRFLLKQQCRQGYFRLNFSNPERKRQGCDAAKAGAKAPDTDVTALAVLILRQVEKKRAVVKEARLAATAWLERRQAADGSFGGGPSTEAPNANSTGLAAWALGDAGSCGPAREAARWIRALQVKGDVSGTPLEGEGGALAYDDAAMAAAEQDGITVETRDQWRRTSAQAVPGLEYLNLAACRR